ncbi:MAG: branched-chain amino acid ABC transporter substrate-binding protein [Pseudopedobacter sp.]|nr:branched-chain amino acid ABC transporter substrate-binding protein [Deinococcales bacterium]
MKKVILLSLVLSSTVFPARAQDLPIITVGYMAPLSGSLSGIGEEVRNVALKALNDARGEFKKLGFDLRFKSFDDADQAEKAKTQAQAAVADPNVLVLIGPLYSDSAVTASDFLFSGKLAMLSPTATATILTDRGLISVNRLVARDDAQADAAVKFLTKTLGAQSVTLINDSTSAGRSLTVQIASGLRDAGVKVLGNIGTTPIIFNNTDERLQVLGKADFSNVLSTIKDLKPNVVYFGGQYDTAAALLSNMKKAGISVPFVGSDNLNSSSFYRLARENAKNIYITSTVAPPAAYPRAKSFAANYQKTFQKEVSGVGLLAFDATQVALEALRTAIKQAGGKKPTRSSVMAALRKVNIEGTKTLTGDIAFNQNGDRVKSMVYILQVGNDLRPRVGSVIPITLK